MAAQCRDRRHPRRELSRAEADSAAVQDSAPIRGARAWARRDGRRDRRGTLAAFPVARARAERHSTPAAGARDGERVGRARAALDSEPATELGGLSGPAFSAAGLALRAPCRIAREPRPAGPAADGGA